MVHAPNRGLIPLRDFFTDGHDLEPPSSVLIVRADVVRLRLKSRPGTHEVRSLYALDVEERLIFLTVVLEEGCFFKQSWGCSLDKATQDLEASHLGIYMGCTSIANSDRDGGSSLYRNEEAGSAILLIVEQKETFFERIGMCYVNDAEVRARMKFQTIRLG